MKFTVKIPEIKVKIRIHEMANESNFFLRRYISKYSNDKKLKDTMCLLMFVMDLKFCCFLTVYIRNMKQTQDERQTVIVHYSLCKSVTCGMAMGE
jgi:hypothetical protein